MSGAHYAAFVELCEKLEKTPGRNQKIQLVAAYLRTLSPEEAKIAAYMLVGRATEEKGKTPLNVGWAAVRDVLDAGITKPLVETPLTLLELWSSLKSAAQASGEGSRTRKKAVIEALLSRMSEVERKWFIRMLFGEMRHGVSAGLLLDAIAQVSGLDAERVRRLDMVIGDIGELAKLAVKGKLTTAGMRLFSPVRPMLAEMSETAQDAIREHGGKTAFEPKFDGVRLQIHKQGDVVRLYTRRLSDVTHSLPDVVDVVKRAVKASEAVLDAEVVAVDQAGKALPFQETMRRLGRERDVEEAVTQIPLQLKVFDILYLEGDTVIDKPYMERHRLLERVVEDGSLLAEQLITDNAEEAERFMERVLEQGHEGLIAKDPRSAYTPGRRGGHWLKIKPAERLDVVIIAAEWGHGRRQGWLSNYHLAVLDKETGSFEMVGKTFKGLTDREFEEMTRRLQEIKLADTEWGLIVRPEIVVEVAYNEIQRSPHYRSGYALRFARITRIRDDKPPSEVDTLQRLRMLYEKQFEKKGRLEE
ncbi:MAG: ATP-dependent DNA ligase [Aigarchaeota archaeon]|nr:ATP-dependent DNA ligase [Candidatus Pelearchaeum maunauluense]